MVKIPPLPIPYGTHHRCVVKRKHKCPVLHTYTRHQLSYSLVSTLLIRPLAPPPAARPSS